MELKKKTKQNMLSMLCGSVFAHFNGAHRANITTKKSFPNRITRQLPFLLAICPIYPRNQHINKATSPCNSRRARICNSVIMDRRREDRVKWRETFPPIIIRIEFNLVTRISFYFQRDSLILEPTLIDNCVSKGKSEVSQMYIYIFFCYGCSYLFP